MSARVDGEFFRLQVIDEIVGSFFQHRPVQSLLERAETFACDGGVGIDYNFRGQTYDGCLRVQTHEDIDGNRSHHLIVVMAHDSRRRREDDSVVHQGLSSESLESENLGNLKHVMEQAEAHSMDFSYDSPRNRMEILFFQNDATPIMTIVLKHGFPKNNKCAYAVELN